MINKENLEKLLAFCKENKEKLEPLFDMNFYRNGDKTTHECKSVGCLIGHSIILDDFKNIPINISTNRDLDNNRILFTEWSRNFYFINYTEVKDGNTWEYLFYGQWACLKETNTINHAMYRIEKILNGYDPILIFGEFEIEEERLS